MTWAVAAAVGVAVLLGVALVVSWARRRGAANGGPAPAGELGPPATVADDVAPDRESEARDQILASLEEGVTLLDTSGRVLYQNAAARRLVGSIPHMTNLDPPPLRELVASVMDGASSRSREMDLPVGTRTVQAGALAIPGQGRVLLTLRDVTEARAVDGVRRDFVANASHELKTPVASIRALAETIATSAGDDPHIVPRFARQLEREAVRLSRIVSDLLDLSRLEGHPGTFTLVRLDLLVPREAERLTARAEEAHLRLAIHTPEAVTIRGSAQDLGLLLRNLVENAIQYTRPGGSVDVGLDTDNGWARLSVADTGLGIPAREQGRIFERFYRVDRARSRETGGTGLGLSIVRHVAENHGGTVAVTSALGQGSTFTVRLPVAGP